MTVIKFLLIFVVEHNYVFHYFYNLLGITIRQATIVQLQLKTTTFPFNGISPSQQDSLKELFNLVWDIKDVTTIHPKEMNATSFCAMIENSIVGYVGVISWNISVSDVKFTMCGLSCVCTHPSYRNLGIGTHLVQAATDWIIQNEDKFDIGFFTCSQELIHFYKHIKHWKLCDNLILKESDRANAIQSDNLNLHVFKLPISSKAKSHAKYFNEGTIILNFPKGKFI